jgi:hypothetical protein
MDLCRETALRVPLQEVGISLPGRLDDADGPGVTRRLRSVETPDVSRHASHSGIR